ncbi:MAG: dTDP-glucose 4,6-dehydratase [Terriglobia bacterium]
MKLLVTGGAGFIGSNFIRYFLQAHPGSTILNLDKLTYAGNLDNLSGIEDSGRHQFIRGDICEAGTVDPLLLRERVDAVVHFAAESHVDRSITDARTFIQTNVLGTFTLLDACRRLQVPRFIHVSTDEVYGSLRPGESATENSSLQPNSPYAASKASSDLLARSFWQTYRFPVIVTRCTNNYGPYQFPEKLMPLMITNAMEGKKLPVYGDGLNERDWIFVHDHCSALDQVLHLGKPGEVYNIGFGEPVTNLEIVRKLLQILNKPENLIEFVPDRPGHDRRYALDTGKICRELKWRPTVGLAEGLAQTVKWYSEHTDWVLKTKSGEYRSYYQKLYENRSESLAQL